MVGLVFDLPSLWTVAIVTSCYSNVHCVWLMAKITHQKLTGILNKENCGSWYDLPLQLFYFGQSSIDHHNKVVICDIE